MTPTTVLTRPPSIRYASAATLAVIIAWAAITDDPGSFGQLAYPAIIAIQAWREFNWQLEASSKGLFEKAGFGPSREIGWDAVDGVLMPDSAWWRLNPILVVRDAPNVQMTAGDPAIKEVLELAVRKGKPVEGTEASVTLTRSLLPWIVLLSLSSLLLGAELAGRLG